MNIKKTRVCIFLFMTTFCATTNAKWYAVNTEYMGARIDDFIEINSSVNRIVFSFELPSSCAELGFSSPQSSYDQYITANGKTEIWNKYCLKRPYHGSYVIFRADKDTSRDIIQAFHGKQPVKFMMQDFEFSVPTTGFNEAYKLLRD